MLFRLEEASFLLTCQLLMFFFGDLDVLAILIGQSVYAICCIILIHICFLKCAYLVTPCTICFLLSVSIPDCVLEDTIFSCLIIVLHCTKDPLLFVHYLNLFNMFNCIELLTSYAMSLFWCAFVASILKVTYLLTYLLTNVMAVADLCAHTHTHTHTLTEENVAAVEELTVSQEDTVHKSWRKATAMHSRQICCRRTAMASMQLTTSFWGTWFSNESKVQDVNDLMQHLRRRAGRGAVGAERVARMSRESVPSPQGKGIHFDVCWRTFFKAHNDWCYDGKGIQQTDNTETASYN